MTHHSTHAEEPRQQQQALLDAMLQSLVASGEPVQLFETHISWVLVTTGTAWKFKKAVRLDILDFTTLEARRQCCLEELRLNRRLAGDLYLGLDAICGSLQAPRLADANQCTEPVLEYAVRMRTFPQEALWDQRAANDLLTFGEAAGLGQLLGQFHRNASAATADDSFGDPARLLAVSRSNRHEIGLLLQHDEERELLRAAGERLEQSHRALMPVRIARKSAGYVRECHGDLHCSNLLTHNGRALAFDCIEFNPVLRWIDVIDDIAFAVMDLRRFGRPLLAACLLDAWLQETGDYGGLPLLNPSMAERALVRCKVGLIRARQQQGPAARASRDDALAYLSLAQQCLASQPARLVITHGFSGSGKSTVAAALARRLGAIRLRSDIERKRLQGMAPASRPTAGQRQVMYAQPARQQVMEQLARHATDVLGCGITAIVDATFLDRPHRDRLAQAAATCGVPLSIVDCQAQPATLRERIRSRLRANADPSDADLDVLERQLAQHDALAADELQHVIAVDTEIESPEDAAQRVSALLDADV